MNKVKRMENMAEDEKIELDEESTIEDADQDDNLSSDELELNIDEVVDGLSTDEDLDSTEDEQMDLLDLEEDFSLGADIADETPSEYGNIDLLLDISLDLVIELGRLRRRIGDVLKLKQGAVLELNKAAGEPVDIYINDRLIAKGEVVVHDEVNLGIKILNILNPADRLRSLRS